VILLNDLGITDNLVCADHIIRLGIVLMITHIVVRLQPDPLLTLGQEAIIAGLSLSRLPHCGREGRTEIRTTTYGYTQKNVLPLI